MSMTAAFRSYRGTFWQVVLPSSTRMRHRSARRACFMLWGVCAPGMGKLGAGPGQPGAVTGAEGTPPAGQPPDCVAAQLCCRLRPPECHGGARHDPGPHLAHGGGRDSPVSASPSVCLRVLVMLKRHVPPIWPVGARPQSPLWLLTDARPLTRGLRAQSLPSPRHRGNVSPAFELQPSCSGIMLAGLAVVRALWGQGHTSASQPLRRLGGYRIPPCAPSCGQRG